MFSFRGFDKFSNIFFLFLEAEFSSEVHTGIPWQAGLRRGSALDADGDSMIVKEEGFYFVYSQVVCCRFIVFPHRGAAGLFAKHQIFYIGGEHAYTHCRRKRCTRSKHTVG